MKRVKLILDEVQWSIAREVLAEAEIPFSIINEQFSSLFLGIAELMERFSPRFRLLFECAPRSYPDREGKELLMLWKRK